MKKVLLKKNFYSWIKKFSTYNIYAPLKIGDIWSYELIDNPEDILLEYPNTEIPPKKVLFPQREVLFEYESSKEKDIKLKEVVPAEKPAIIFGVRSCDARGLAKMEKIFTGDVEDVYFSKKKSQTLIVGLACNDPHSYNCFCTTVKGSPYSLEGLDVLMTDMGDKYYVETNSKRGEELIKAGSNFFKDPEDNDIEELEKIHKIADTKINQRFIDISDINSRLKKLFDSELWDKESLSCIQCGICTFSCPVCHCFDINDEVICTFPLKGKRVRTWDNCQFPDFTMHSSGHNPREDKASRLRQRMMHKFNYFNKNCSEYLCTGCGRCITNCPVKIDIVEVLEKVILYDK